MEINQKLKLNDEVIDVLCSVFKGAEILIENDSEIATLYAYLLLQATGIERLQKIVYIIDYFNKNGDQITDKELKNQLGHNIIEIHQQYLEDYFIKYNNDKVFFDKALQILTELITVKDGYRYANFNLYNDKLFSIHEHIVKILEIDGLDYSGVNDLIKSSWKIIDVILKKYISILVNLIWRKIIGNGEIIPICLQKYVIAGYQEIDLINEISHILDNTRKKD